MAQRQEGLVTVFSELAATDVPAFDDPGRLPITAGQMLALLEEKGVLGQTVVRIPRSSGQNWHVVSSVLTERQFMEAWHDARTFVRGCAGVHHTHGPDEQQGLSQQEFVEVLARCAQHKYAELNMQVAQARSPMAPPLLAVLSHVPSAPARPPQCEETLQRCRPF